MFRSVGTRRAVLAGTPKFPREYPMAEVVEINDLSDLHPYRATWNSLLGRTPGATFFQTFDWFELYWQHFGGDQQLRVLIVEEHGVAIGILPLCIRTQQHRLGPVRTIAYPLDGWDNFYAPLGDRPTATLTAAIVHLVDTPRNWDRLQLVGGADEHVAGGLTRASMTLGGMPPATTKTGTASIVDLSEGWQAYLDARSAKTRYSIRHHLREVEQSSSIEYVRHRPRPQLQGDADLRWDLFDQCQQVAEHSWQSHTTSGNTLCHSRYRDFYRDTHAAAARLGMLDLNLLYIDGRPVAFNYNYVTNGRLTGLRMGYDQQASRLGAGNLLVAAMLADSCERSDLLLDLGTGGQAFKRRLQSKERTTYELTYTPLTAIRCQALRLARWMHRGGDSGGKVSSLAANYEA